MPERQDRHAASRRDFLATALAATAIATPFQTAACADETSTQLQLPGGRCLDYGRSFIGHRGSHNSVRFWVESRTIVFDDQANTRREFYQCGSCKSEDTFAAKNLFQANNYDFLPIIGREQVMLIRRGPKVK